MAIRVLFDSLEIGSDYIVGLRQNVNPYGDNFKIGNTVCRTFSLDILNNAFDDIPTKVYLYEGQTLYATLYVDEVNANNEKYTTFSLVDVMVQFNQDLTYTTGQTVLQILNTICSAKSITLDTQTFYMSDLAISWQDDVTERDFISYVAEVNGGYAYINESGNLVISAYSNTPVQSIELKDCSSIKIGSRHEYDRVYVELASATKVYPLTSNHDTLYLNPENILFTDSGSYTIQGTIEHVHSVINGLTFYNVHIDACPTTIARACQMLRISNVANAIPTFLTTQLGDYLVTEDGEKILVRNMKVPFLCTIDYNYNSKWNGGYNLEVSSSKQEETQIISSSEKISRVNIKVDRVAGEIRQEVSDLEEDVTASLALKIDKNAQQVISVLEGTATDITWNANRFTINAPTMTFGTTKTISINSYSNGVSFDGNGTVRFNPKDTFELYNKNVSNVLLNELYMSSGYLELNNYDYSGSGVLRNGIRMYSKNSTGNELYITNGSDLAKTQIYMYHGNLNLTARQISSGQYDNHCEVGVYYDNVTISTATNDGTTQSILEINNEGKIRLTGTVWWRERNGQAYTQKW